MVGTGRARAARWGCGCLLPVILTGCAGSHLAGRCSTNEECDPGQACHDSVCRDLCVDSFSCAAGFVCEQGVCQPGQSWADGRPVGQDGAGGDSGPGNEPGNEPAADAGNDADGDATATDAGGDENGDPGMTDPTLCVATWTPVYPASWTCTAAGTNGCYKDPSSYVPATYSETCPDAPYPSPTPRLYAEGYVASYSTGGWDTCSASCGGGTQCRTVTTATFKPDAPSVTAPAACQDCNTQACPQPCYCEELINTTADWYRPNTLLCDGIVDNDSQPTDECVQKYKAGITEATCPSGTIDDLVNTTCCKC